MTRKHVYARKTKEIVELVHPLDGREICWCNVDHNQLLPPFTLLFNICRHYSGSCSSLHNHYKEGVFG